MASQAPLRFKGNFFADPEFFRTDVTKGVTKTPTGCRIITLPSEFLIGFRDALIYECGGSYRQIMKSTGRRWGTQFAKRLERELSSFYQTPFKELPEPIIRTCLAEAFRAHGYGHLSFATVLEHAEFVLAEVRNPLLPALIRESDRTSDLLMAGMLGAVLAHLTGKPLDAVQTECPSLGADRSRFLIGPGSVVAELEEWINEASQMPSHKAILRHLAQHNSLSNGSIAETSNTETENLVGAQAQSEEMSP